jgi:hypothetical protein
MKRDEASSFFKGILLVIAGGLLMLYALDIEIRGGFFLWGILLLGAGGMLVLRTRGAFRR